MATDSKAIGYLEINSKQWDEALAAAGKTLVAFAAAIASVKTAEFFKDGIQNAIQFGNEAYLAAQKLNGYDPGRLLLVQKALQGAGLSAEEARGKIQEFGEAGRPLEQMFKGGQAGFADALTRAAKEYGTQAAVLSQSAEEFAFVQGQIGALGTKLQGFFLGLADKIANPLSSLLSEIDKIDLVGMGEKFGAYIVTAINTIKGLISNGDLFSTLGLALKVGFEIAVDFLLQPSLWSGIVKVAVGAFALLGSFLTSTILGIGKLLIATLEAAFERVRQKYAGLAAFIGGPIAQIAMINGQHASTDVGVNLANIEKGSLIQQQEQGAGRINSTALTVALSGLTDLVKAGKGTSLSGADTQKLATILAKAADLGASQAGANGKKNPIFSETADAFHVITDSLARVGGGGRYVRTGLSISEKAALDALRYQKQSAEADTITAKILTKIQASLGQTGGRISMQGG